MREVSGDPYKWRLSDFFTELFNYCFPINFRLYELNELWNMIGETDERAKVHKLWFGLRKELQKDLWKEKLNPEISSLKKIATTAEILEIAQSVTDDHTKRFRRHQHRRREPESTAAPQPEEAGPSKHWRKRHRRRRDGQDGPARNHNPSEDNQHRRRDKRVRKDKRDNPKLSKDEQERHKAEGLCFICHKSGHFSRNCPERHKVSSSSKPPGVSSFGVDVDFGDVENQRHLALSSEGDPVVMSNFIHIRGPTVHEDEEEADDIPDLESIWSDDESGDSVTTDENDPLEGMRIHAYDRRQFLGQRATGPEIGTPLSKHIHGHPIRCLQPRRWETYDMERPAFRLDSWYWFRRGERLGISRSELRRQDQDRVWQSRPMGRPVAEAIVAKLEEFCPPVSGGGNAGRFACTRKPEFSTYVLDNHLSFCFEVPPTRVDDPEFDIVQWYATRLIRASKNRAARFFDPYTISLNWLFHSDEEPEDGDWLDLGDELPLQRNAAIAKDFTRRVPKPWCWRNPLLSN